LTETPVDTEQDMKQENVDPVSKDETGSATVKSEIDNNIIPSSALLEDGNEVKVEFTCEMCSETFTKRSELLIHVPIHI
jgi:hypothetical protein